MMHESSWTDRLLGTCVKLLAAAIALNFTVCIIQAIWPVLAIIAGVVALIWLVIVVYRATKNHW